MNEVILICIVGCINLLCFYAGAKIGQTSVRNETIHLPNPVKAVEEYKESKEYREEQERVNIMLENINNYDGTGLGQKDIP